MSIYTIVLFLHVSGAIGYFIGNRFPDDHEAFAPWLSHRDSGCTGTWFGFWPARLSCCALPGAACGSQCGPHKRRVDRIAALGRRKQAL